MAIKTVFITTPGLSTFTIPSDFGAFVSVEAIGGGGGTTLITGSSGGGGGAYAKSTSISGLVANAVAYVSIGVGGSNTGGNGGDTWFNKTNTVPTSSTTGTLAKGGSAGVQPTLADTFSGGGLGGDSASCVGNLAYSGGTGGNTYLKTGRGGGAFGASAGGGAAGAGR